MQMLGVFWKIQYNMGTKIKIGKIEEEITGKMKSKVVFLGHPVDRAAQPPLWISASITVTVNVRNGVLISR